MRNAEYDVTSEHPPMKDQVHYCGLHTSNVKAAICASQPPDPRKTMLFLEELIIEILVQPILRFVLDNFLSLALTFNDERYTALRESTDKMLKSVELFLEYPELADDLESYDCHNPVSYKELHCKASCMSRSKPRVE